MTPAPRRSAVARRRRALAQGLPPGDAAQRVLRQFRVVFNAVKTHFRQVEKQVGLGGAQVWALSIIQATPDAGVRALAAAMNIHQSTASNLVRSLAERELISVARDPTDRRAVRLHLLPAGAELLERSPAPFAGVLPDALAALDARTLQRIEHDLEKLIAVLQVDADAARTPLAEL
ncbi:MarR family winged helix-turn-helix transcriptional regulator [Piscinibacter koreensis]|uniref:MarR family winged helix-turn-helix transcriptional regulator n=1 Tax=Piscinibacter koreensis TaxID=2742824 RepID=UPI0031586660